MFSKDFLRKNLDHVQKVGHIPKRNRLFYADSDWIDSKTPIYSYLQLRISAYIQQ